ncbi:MAG: hypothetical protein LBR81_04670 [Prevotellaceae bacterium]|nr:hypothetical protein [Prevotellaceae bacterium]
MKKLVVIALLSIPLWVQTRTLTLFSKPSCNNCRYSKYMLQKNGIAFRDFSLDDKANAAVMLEKLKSAGYAGQIHLPVIIEDDSLLLYPTVSHNDSTLFYLIEKIIADKQSYDIANPNRTTVTLPAEGDGDCTMELDR